MMEGSLEKQYIFRVMCLNREGLQFQYNELLHTMWNGYVEDQSKAIIQHVPVIIFKTIEGGTLLA